MGRAYGIAASKWLAEAFYDRMLAVGMAADALAEAMMKLAPRPPGCPGYEPSSYTGSRRQFTNDGGTSWFTIESEPIRWVCDACGQSHDEAS